jgi:putative transposase
MKTARFSDAQIMHCPTAHASMCERGHFEASRGRTPVSELCREHGMSSASFYKWRAKFGGMDASLIAEMKDMAEQNQRLKRR